jgi:hypothetical protein
VESDVSDVDPRSHRHAERLNGAIEVFVIERVLIVPHPGVWSRHFVAHKPDPIISRIRLDLVCRCACPLPSLDRRLHSYRGGNRRKGEIGCAIHAVLTVGGVVIHVALPRVRLAPGVFVRSDILRFGEIGRARIERCVQIINLNQNPVRNAVVCMAAVVVRCRREFPCKGINPSARTQVWPRIETRAIWV